MRIKKLEIFGFKSFKDRTVIQFDEGITGIVGPNGCGKSNIVDALVWVMGEMSAKHLRGSSMEDVIFAGAEGYAPMGLAEVSLTLENDGGPFPAQYSRFTEIMVTRRLNRSGESEYLINKEAARLRDIQEIFMDTGAGSKGFSIIEQGAIGKIITAKPEDRRVLIEEAAGITKFRVRKRESQRKLESTDQNLVRLQDIIGEQKRQIDSLERQAQRAERYRKIKTELQEKDLWLAANTYLKLHDDTVAAEAEYDAAKTVDVGGEAHLSELEARVSALRLKLVEAETAVQTRQTEHRDGLSRVQEMDFRIRELNMAIDQARRSNEMTGSILSQYQLRKENLENEKSVLDDRLINVRETLIRMESEYTEKDAELQLVNQRIQSADNELTDVRRKLLAVQSGMTHLEARKNSLNAKFEDESKRKEQIVTIMNELQGQLTDFSLRRNQVFSRLEHERQMQLDLTKDVDLIDGNLKEVRMLLEQRRSESDRFKDELNQVASRLYGLENLQHNFEGFEDGVKNIMMWQRQRVEAGSATESQKFQPLAEVIEVPAQYEMAMEASLGTRLQLLLSDSSEQAVGAMDYLKERKQGRSSFYSGDLAVVEESFLGPENELRQEPGFQVLLKDVVQVPDHFQRQLSNFFSDVVVVDSVKTALRLRPSYPARTFVTLEGDVLSKDGVLSGGAIDSADSGVLKRRREIKELSLQREEISGKVQLSQLTVKKLVEQEQGVQKQLEDAKRTAVDKEISIAELRKDLERAEVELSNAKNAVEKETRHLQQIEIAISEVQNILNDVSNQWSELQSQSLHLTTSSESLAEELKDLKAGIDDKTRYVMDLRVSLASRRQEAESTEREVHLVGTTLTDVLGQLAQMSEETERNENTLTSSQVAVETLQTDLQRSRHQTQELELLVSQSRNQFELVQAEVREAEAVLSKTMHDLNVMRSRMSEAQLRLEQSKMKSTLIVEQIFERYQTDLREVAGKYRDIPLSIDENNAFAFTEQKIEQYTKDVEELRDKLRRIGEVNLSAIQEYDDVIKRYEFLSTQHQDLMDAKDNLRKVIDRINRICSRRFKETFDQVNERFTKVFPVLFGGGEAQLVLIENPDNDEPGIDIISRPPGKKLQNVSLLSGGEKALTAVSLIFSIFLVKPSPFCLLDEVDAPLDDANVYRFNDLVREMAKRSQIIVVTHNKHTMKVNNKLYGVTMQEKGVSKMVSVSLADAEKLAT